VSSIKYNVYYSTQKDGPWVLGNPTPIDHSQEGNSYTLSSLQKGTTYYIRVVGGYLNTEDEFVPLITQPVGPQTLPAQGISAVKTTASIIVKEYLVRIISDSIFEHQFEVI